MVKNLPANADEVRDADLIPGSGRSPEEGNGIPLQYSCLGNPIDRGAWWATVHGVAKSQTQLKQLSMHAETLQLFRNRSGTKMQVFWWLTQDFS